MRLKSIKLAGFKSFVDPTTVNFPSNLSAVVGPNGCGKSNIIDAVRWVMGESSAKNLRGEAMTDVIFNGSNTRKPIGQASIELIFDNSAGKLAGEYGRFSEISIKRKVTRDSDNIYYLNGNKCRRRDITDLFLGTGLGPRSYAIIEQGMISRLIEARPEDLRVYVEEAAGISKYKERRRDTENRMRHTRENLERLQDIRDELERQLGRLERQAAAARKFRELKAEEREVRARLAAAELKLLLDQQRTQTRGISELELKVEAEVTARVARNAEIERERLASESEIDAFNKVQARFYEAGAEINRLQQALNFGRERQQQVARDLDQCERDLAEARAHERTDSERCAALEHELENLIPDVEMARETEAECELEVETRDGALHQWQSAWDAFNARAAGPRQRAEVEQSRIQYLEQVQQRTHERLKRASAEQVAAGLQQADAEALAELELTIAALDEERVELAELIEAATARLEQGRAIARDSTAQLDSRRRAASQLQGRIASLEALQQAALGGGDRARAAWLEKVGLAQFPRLADVLQVPDGWQRAAEAALGSALQARLVPSLEPYVESLGSLPGGEMILIEAEASAVGGLAAEWAQAAGAILSGLAPAGDAAEALARRSELAPGTSLLAPDGIQVGRHWLKVARRAAGDSGVLARARELEECATQLAADEHAIAQFEEALASARAAEGEAEAELTTRRTRQTVVARELAGHQNQLAQKTAKLQRERELSERAERDAAEAREQLRLETAQLAEARGALELAIDAMRADTEERERLTAEHAGLREALNSARTMARTARDRAEGLAARRQSAAAQLSAIREAAERGIERLSQLSARREELAMNAEAAGEPLLQLESELEAALDVRVAVEAELARARSAMDTKTEHLRRLEQQQLVSEQTLQRLRGELENARLEAKGLSTQAEAQTEALTAEGFQPEELIERLTAEDQPSLLATAAQDIARRIERLGAINLAAIEEYSTEAERKRYLDEQHQDLTEALTTLEGAIQKIDRETRARFKETFDAINSGLQNLFPRVFGGGEAYLELTGEDLLDTGIAIMARPPGKRNSTIHLLSGGEKALTAIALVFAIFQLNPAPFCMLDEVDAPLDDANVGRYARMVEQMSANVQFIYITHNKIAMEMAHQLMGVTMHEPGVSRIVTVDVEEAAELAAV